ncbi:MAG: RpiB/LacA/LacB family sugar-phosphate isomerase, partial [Victivallales bacterium]|nr:RpiB/LacA/LacB family sugar-phosphate isomerase [Victivallales bacterium]
MIEINDWYGKSLRVAIGTDHGGFAQKAELSTFLESKNCRVIDCGPFAFDSGDDYPDFGVPAAKAITRNEADIAILICRSGVGMGILANRFHGVRAVCASSADLAQKSRQHNCSNVLVLPGDVLDVEGMKTVVSAWLDTPFSGDMRHLRRLEKIETKTYDDIVAVRYADP